MLTKVNEPKWNLNGIGNVNLEMVAKMFEMVKNVFDNKMNWMH